MTKTLYIMMLVFVVTYFSILTTLEAGDSSIGGIQASCYWTDITYLPDSDFTYTEVFGESTLYDGTGMNLIENGDMSLDSNSDNIPDNFSIVSLTNLSLTDGIFYGEKKYTSLNGIYYTYSFDNHIYYSSLFAKADTSNLFSIYSIPTDFQYFTQNNDLTNEFVKYSGIINSNGNDTMITFRISGNIGSNMYFKEINMFDLTSIYNSETSRTQAQFEEDMAKWESKLGKKVPCEYEFQTDSTDDIDGYDLGNAKIREIFTTLTNPFLVLQKFIEEAYDLTLGAAIDSLADSLAAYNTTNDSSEYYTYDWETDTNATVTIFRNILDWVTFWNND